MTDREAFIAAIVANPQEDAPRLVFADWLEENGEAARAGFIRDQIRLARLRPSTDEYKQLFRKTAETLKANLPAWIQDACDAFGQPAEWQPRKASSSELEVMVGGTPGRARKNLISLTFSRGLIGTVYVRPLATQDLNPFERLLSENPITHLKLVVTKPFHIGSVLVSSLRRIRSIALWWDFEEPDVTTLFSQPLWENLQQIVFAEPTSMSLASLCPTSMSIASLCKLPVAKQLRSLQIPLDSLHLHSLRQFPLDDRLEELVLRHSVTASTFTEFASITSSLNELPFRATLKRLDLYFLNMGDSGLAAFARGEVWVRLRSLVLDRNDITDLGWRDFVRGRRTPELRMLSAAHNRIANDGATRLAQSELGSKLEYLDLRHNRISGPGALALARSLAESPLKKLLLTGNPINKTDAATIRKLLGNRVD
jgi:uncharacterized protein (TIGR02996 family)